MFSRRLFSTEHISVKLTKNDSALIYRVFKRELIDHFSIFPTLIAFTRHLEKKIVKLSLAPYNKLSLLSYPYKKKIVN